MKKWIQKWLCKDIVEENRKLRVEANERSYMLAENMHYIRRMKNRLEMQRQTILDMIDAVSAEEKISPLFLALKDMSLHFRHVVLGNFKDPDGAHKSYCEARRLIERIENGYGEEKEN